MRRLAVLLHHAQHRFAVLGELTERSLDLGHARRLGERPARHDRGERACESAALLGVIGEAHRHQERAEVGVAKAQGAKRLRVLADRGSGVRGVGDDDLLAGEADVDRVPVPLDVELAVFCLELHQVERQQVACGVVQEHELRARVGRVDAARVGDHVPVLDGGVELQARVAADPGRFGDLPPQVASLVAVDDPTVDDGFRLPLLVAVDRSHEIVAHADGVVGVLELDRVVRPARHVEPDVVAGLDQGPRLLLFFRLAADELENVGVVGVEDDHLGRAASRPSRLDRAGERVVALHEGDGAGGGAATGQLLLGGTQHREVGASAAAELEQHAFRLDQLEDRLHRVLHRVDEARRTLLGAAGHADVEPDRAVEGGVLRDQEVAELLGPVLRVFLAREVAAFASPTGQGFDDPVDQLADAGLALGGAHAAPEVLLGDDVDRELRPGAGDLDVLLLEDDLALLAGDRCGSPLPLHQVEGVAAWRREAAPKAKPFHGSCFGVAPVWFVPRAGSGEVGNVFGHFFRERLLQSSPVWVYSNRVVAGTWGGSQCLFVWGWKRPQSMPATYAPGPRCNALNDTNGFLACQAPNTRYSASTCIYPQHVGGLPVDIPGSKLGTGCGRTVGKCAKRA